MLATKFLEGAWVVLALIPALCWLFSAVHRHYAIVRKETDCDLPLIVSDLRPPIVVIVMRRWSTITRNAIRFAMSISPEVVAVHVTADRKEGGHLASKWRHFVEKPLLAHGKPVPNLVFVDSPYRQFLDPLFQTLERIGAEHPERTLAVVVPELAGGRWYDYFLHNQRSTALKAALLVRGGPRVVLA